MRNGAGQTAQTAELAQSPKDAYCQTARDAIRHATRTPTRQGRAGRFAVGAAVRQYATFGVLRPSAVCVFGSLRRLALRRLALRR